MMAPVKTGIIDLYVTHAKRHLDEHVQAGTPKLISRKIVERQILTGLDEAKFPIDMKIAWYHTILSTDAFESLWCSATARHRLRTTQIIRYLPDPYLQEYIVPEGDSKPSDSDLESSSPPHKKVNVQKSATPDGDDERYGNSNEKPTDSDSDSDSNSDDSNDIDPTDSALAAKLGEIGGDEDADSVSKPREGEEQEAGSSDEVGEEEDEEEEEEPSPALEAFAQPATDTTTDPIPDPTDDDGHDTPSPSSPTTRGNATDSLRSTSSPTLAPEPTSQPTPKGSAKHVKSEGSDPRKMAATATLKRKRDEAIAKGVINATALGEGKEKKARGAPRAKKKAKVGNGSALARVKRMKWN